MKTTNIFLHGALGAAAQFDRLLPLLPSDYPAVAWSLPGHGQQLPEAPFSLDLFTSALLKFLDEIKLDAVNIFGYSMGGYLALHLASEHPERVKRVITLGTKLQWSPEVAAGMNRMFDPEKIEAKVPQFATSLAAMHADWKAVCRHTAAFLEELGNGQGIQEAAYARIACPVTIGWGNEDNVVGKEESQHVAGLIPQGEFVELMGVKHPIDLVDSNILVKFVERLSSPLPPSKGG